MKEPRDYTRNSFRITGLVILMLVCVSFIPPFSIGSVKIKRANILSDIISMGDTPRSAFSPEPLLDTSFLEGFSFPDSPAVYPEETYGGVGGEYMDSMGHVTGAGDSLDRISLGGTFTGKVPSPLLTRASVADSTLVPIEDFSPGKEMMTRFYNSLAYESGERVIRIAVLGDSFIEGDIITADMREQMQLKYGGGGVGFVPFTTPLSKHRGTVKHTFSGWDYYNVMQKKTTPEQYKEKYFVSGILSVPKQGATVRYEGVKFRRGIEESDTATLIFENSGNSTLKVVVNDSLTSSHTPESRDGIGYISVGAGSISKLDISVSEPEGFIGYGVVFEDAAGVSVHNYAVRSNSGLALFGTDATVNRQVDSLMNYDLVILQYGLNVMSSDVFDYGYYERHLVRIIEYVKQCFPGSAVLVMSIGDRSTLKSGTAVTMPEVHAMIKTQKSAAAKGGAAFWNTLDGMGGENSMAEFVKNKWAAKDHTHINYSGGRQIAGKLVAYIDAAVESIIRQDAESGKVYGEKPVEAHTLPVKRPEEGGAVFADSLARVIMERIGGSSQDADSTENASSDNETRTTGPGISVKGDSLNVGITATETVINALKASETEKRGDTD